MSVPTKYQRFRAKTAAFRASRLWSSSAGCNPNRTSWANGRITNDGYLVRPDKHSMLAMRMFWNVDGVERENGLDMGDSAVCSSRCVFLVHLMRPYH